VDDLSKLADATVLTLEGEVAVVRDLWRGRPTVLAFVRHFGCLFCHELVAKLKDAVDPIEARGGRLVIIGNGSVDHARRFFADKGFDLSHVTLVTDPGRSSFRAAGMGRGVGVTFLNGGSLGAFRRARSAGHRITGAFGDVFQLGGVVVVKPPGEVVYEYVSKFAGDDPDIEQVIAAVR
jgi:peroxiredoxin